MHSLEETNKSKMKGKLFQIKLSGIVNALSAVRNKQHRTKSDVTGFARG
jgi:hypothetical protein